jgi:queuosine precursor transporter
LATRNKLSVLTLITACYVTVLALTPAASSKFIVLGSLTMNGAILFFPLSYLFNDIVTEVYGYAQSRRIMWVGFAAQVFAAGIYSLIGAMPAAPFWHEQAAYDIILGQTPRIVLGTLVAYFFGEFVNSFTVSKLKYFHAGKAGKFMAMRFVLSTFIGEFVDSCFFLGIAFYGIIPTNDLMKTIIISWALKTLYEIFSLPISMPLVAWIKRAEAIDVIDQPENTNYTPFKF